MVCVCTRPHHGQIAHYSAWNFVYHATHASTPNVHPQTCARSCRATAEHLLVPPPKTSAAEARYAAIIWRAPVVSHANTYANTYVLTRLHHYRRSRNDLFESSTESRPGCTPRACRVLRHREVQEQKRRERARTLGPEPRRCRCVFLRVFPYNSGLHKGKALNERSSRPTGESLKEHGYFVIDSAIPK